MDNFLNLLNAIIGLRLIPKGELARRCGINPIDFSQMLRGRKKISPEKKILLIQILNIEEKIKVLEKNES